VLGGEGESACSKEVDAALAKQTKELNDAAWRRQQFVSWDSLIRDYRHIGKQIKLVMRTPKNVKDQALRDAEVTETLKADLDAKITKRLKCELDVQLTTLMAEADSDADKTLADKLIDRKLKEELDVMADKVGVAGNAWFSRLFSGISTDEMVAFEIAAHGARIQEQYEDQLEAARAWQYFYKSLKALHKADSLPEARFRSTPSKRQVEQFLKNCEPWDRVNCAGIFTCRWPRKKPLVYDFVDGVYMPELARAKDAVAADVKRKRRS
jgi:hypothetical protein